METTEKNLQDRIHKLSTEKKQLALDNKIALEDIKHMTRIKGEKLEIEAERKEVERDRQKDKEVLKIKNEYRDKVEKLLESGREDLRGMYSEILERLPNINVKLGGDIG